METEPNTPTAANGETKPGWLTSEHWQSFVVVITALVAGVGALGLSETHWAVRASAFVSAALASIVYTIARTVAKDRALKKKNGA